MIGKHVQIIISVVFIVYQEAVTANLDGKTWMVRIGWYYLEGIISTASGALVVVVV